MQVKPLAAVVAAFLFVAAHRASAQELPSAAPSAAAPEDPDLEAPYPKRGHFVFGGGAGASAMTLHADAIFMGGGFLSFGADTRVASFDGLVRYQQGQTEQGLTARSFNVAVQFSWVLDRLRLGLAVGPGYFGVERITSPDSFDYLTFGAEGLLGVDLVRTDGFSFGLALRPRIEGAAQFTILGDSDNTAIGGATLGLELRMRAPRAPKKAVTALL